MDSIRNVRLYAWLTFPGSIWRGRMRDLVEGDLAYRAAQSCTHCLRRSWWRRSCRSCWKGETSFYPFLLGQKNLEAMIHHQTRLNLKGTLDPFALVVRLLCGDQVVIYRCTYNGDRLTGFLMGFSFHIFKTVIIITFSLAGYKNSRLALI